MVRLILFISIFYLSSSIHAQTIPTPSQTDEIIIDMGSSGKADPNDRIRYKVTIQNTGGANGTGTQLNIVPDPRTTFVTGSFRSSPLALNDAYTCTGNVGISVSAVSGLLTNDFDDNIPGLTCTVVTNVATTQGGSISITANGSFTYTPAAGFTGSDTYIYTLNDGNPVSGVPLTDMGTITFTVSNLIWFIDNSAAAGDGRLNTPFNSLASFNSGSATAGDVIYLEQTGTNYTGGITLQNNERLYGKGHTGAANLAGVLPFSLAPNSLPLPNINSTRPIITNAVGDGVTLASANALRGFDVGNCSDFGIENSGTTSVGNLVVSEVSITTSTGGGFDASHGSGAGMNAVFTSITTTGGTNGINLTNCDGTFNVNGGTITNPTGAGVLISGGAVSFTCAAAINDNTGFAVDIDNHDSNNVTFSGTITTSGTGVRLQNCGGGTKTFSGTITTSAGTAITANNNNGGTVIFSGSSKMLTTGTNTAINLTSNTGATINFTNGGLVITSTSGAGFTATGGGTVTVQGTGNTINSSTGTALNITNTTIGASNINFQSVSANGGLNGIVINNTGTGRFIITGNGNSSLGGDNSGGTIQNTTGDAISLTSTNNPSFTNINIQNIGRSGIDGMSVTSFTLANSTINNVGTAAAGQYEESNLAFNDGGTFTSNAISGTISITQNILNNARRHGIQIENWTGTISNITVSNNTFTSSTSAVASLGHAVLVLTQGTASTNAHLVTGTFSNNTITFFPNGSGIFIAGGVGNTSNNTSSTLGATGTPINITGNVIGGTAGTKMGSNAIIVSFNGQVGVSNFNISNNGSLGNPLGHFQGLGISVFMGGSVTGSSTVSGNVLVSNQTIMAGSSGIGVQVDDGPAGLGTSQANYNFTVSNNSVSANEGSGILAIVRASLGFMDVTIQNNSVTAPTMANRNGIRVLSGSTAGDVTLCMTMTGNSSDGSGVNQGIGIRKQGTVSTVNDFGIVGLSPSPTTGANAAAKIVTDNPAGGGCDVISGDNYVSCTITP